MNLLCPSCQKMVTVDNQFAGQQMRCPHCNSIFTVPSLPAAPPAAPPPPPAPAPFRMPESAPPPPAPAAPPSKPSPPPEPEVTRDYEKMRSIFISPKVLPWVTLNSIVFLVLLTLLPWIPGKNAWEIGFGKDSRVVLGLYSLLVVFGMLAAVAEFLWHLKVIPAVPSLMPWRAVIVGAFIFSSFLILFTFYLQMLLEVGAAGGTFVSILAFWTHLVAVVSLLLEVWIQRRGPSYPPPRIDIHW